MVLRAWGTNIWVQGPTSRRGPGESSSCTLKTNTQGKKINQKWSGPNTPKEGPRGGHPKMCHFGMQIISCGKQSRPKGPKHLGRNSDLPTSCLKRIQIKYLLQEESYHHRYYTYTSEGWQAGRDLAKAIQNFYVPLLLDGPTNTCLLNIYFLSSSHN